MKSKVVFCLFVMGLSSAAMADASLNTYTYRVEVPSLQISCVDHAVQVANAFAQATQLSLLGEECEGTRTVQEGANTYGIDEIVVSYLATDEAVATRAILGGYNFEGVTDEGSGLFDTYAACYAQLAQQEAAFHSNTGLTAVAAHCDAATEENSGYVLVVEGFGNPLSHLYEYSQSSATVSRDAPEFLAARNVITASGGHVAYVDDSRILYYAPYPIAVFTTYMGIFPDASQCQAQVADAKNALVAGNYDGLNVFCSTWSTGSTALTAVGGGVDMINPITTSDHYASFGDCMNDKARVLANASSSGAKVTGEVCRPDDGNNQLFVLDVYFNRN